MRRLSGVSREFPPGHLFVVKADLLGIQCDAWLLPTDADGWVESPWHRSVGLDAPGQLREVSLQGDRLVTRWDPRAGDEDEPLVFLGAVGVPYGSEVGMAEWVRHTGEVAASFVEAAAAEVRARGAAARPRLAMPLIGTGQAGLGNVAGGLLGPLLDRLDAAAVTVGADVVLCVVDDLAWSAVQHARGLRSAPTDWPLPPSLVPVAEELARRLRFGHLVLFLGAGVSADAGLPAWKDLLQGLGRRMDLDDAVVARLGDLDPRDAAMLLERRAADRSEWIDHVRAELACERSGLTHALLASMSVEATVTTNFDSLYERACTLPGPGAQAPARLPYEAAEEGRPWLLKLHGDLDVGDLVFTRADYLGAERNRAALFGIVQALLVTRHLLFVGYSLSDEDFHRLVDEIGTALQGNDHPHLGTVLVIDDPLWRDLWAGSLDIVEVGGSDDPAANAHQLQILLDLVNHLASDRTRFLLDPRFRGLLDGDEERLGSEIADLAEHVEDLPEDSIVRTAVERLLRELGAPSDTAT